MKTVQRYCSGDISEIENYQQAIDSAEMWSCHHRLETDGEYITQAELIRRNLYYSRPASELIFLKDSEHKALHGSLHPKSQESVEKTRQFHLGRKRSEETRRKISEAKKNHIGWHHSEETKNKIRVANNKDEVVEKNRLSHKNRKQVIQCSLDGEVIQRFSSCREAEKVTGINHGAIIYCCNGKTKSAGGFKWLNGW